MHAIVRLSIDFLLHSLCITESYILPNVPAHSQTGTLYIFSGVTVDGSKSILYFTNNKILRRSLIYCDYALLPLNDYIILCSIISITCEHLMDKNHLRGIIWFYFFMVQINRVLEHVLFYSEEIQLVLTNIKVTFH